MKFFLIFCNNLSNAKNVSELMKNSIERKYGSNASSSGNGKNGSNGKMTLTKQLIISEYIANFLNIRLCL